MIRMTFVLMCCVPIIYSIYILDQPYFLYRFLMGIRILLLLSICFSFRFNRIIIDKNTIILMIYSIYALVRSVIGGGDLLNQTLTIMTWPLIYLIFYSYTKRIEEAPKGYSKNLVKIKRILFVYLIAMTVVSIPLILRHLSGNGRAGEVIFPVYFLLTVLSLIMLFFYPKKWLWVFPCIMIVLTTKRTGLLTIVVGIFLFQISEYHRDNTLKKKWRRLLMIVLMVLVAGLALIAIVRALNLDIFERFMELSEDGGSGRNQIWFQVYLDYKNGTFLELLFGQGYQSVTKMMLTGRAILAHNDYLEILHDYGVIGLILISVWLIQVVFCFFKTWRKRNILLPSFSYTISTISLLSLLSYLFIQSYLMIFIAAYLGIVMAVESKQSKRR